MARHPREPLAALALLALVACSTGGPAASPTPSPVTTSPSVAPSTTTAPPGRTYVLGVLGDYGQQGSAALTAVVRAMRRFAPQLDAVVTTGDNAYCCGTTAQVAFAKRALAPLRAPVYPALGNHDEVTAGGAPLMRAFGLTSRWYDKVVGPVELVVLDANRPADRAQLRFLDGVLARPRRAAFRIVVFHQPGWSCSFHAPEPNVVRLWLPRFTGKADLVLAGHNHTYERFQAPSGLSYVTTGGGGATLYPSVTAACRGAGRMRVIKTVNHALRLTVTGSRLTVEAIGTDGRAFDRFVVSRGNGAGQ